MQISSFADAVFMQIYYSATFVSFSSAELVYTYKLLLNGAVRTFA